MGTKRNKSQVFPPSARGDLGQVTNVSGPRWGPGTTLRNGAGQAAAHLVAVVHGRDDLPEEVACVPLAQRLTLADVVVQVSPAGVLHDDHDPAAVLEH